ncbi:Predicted DNA-binding transcriptional regulator YafY, contains an HTH and WYL domains [Tranquillimonas rosea]|uniref:Predicted DNA-binding transcriptional regulator YafY, contains an HTH and WYL domains n=1 Tax=Tranquillimonas rosea TaxID=641238 RepID=A0A1H9PJ41_9RHOB|nr:WYL domain-containing protein [Tranquillimonas rosea]SER47865.1 Predicted DNA-binding transcriptional regulator YafY, contains an HTH and WYL domains [Tranquillimonas rosea]
MSFTKALQILRLAEMSAARHRGVALQDIEEEFCVDRRTAQRMTKAIEDFFPIVQISIDEAQRKYWKVRTSDIRLAHAQGLKDRELVALDMAIRRAERDGIEKDAASLRTLRERLLSMMPSPHARRAESDAEALLEAQGFASRPGPRVRADPTLLDAITEALRAPFRLTFLYQGARDGAARERRVEPYGLLLGTRPYLVARPVGEDGSLRRFRLDRMQRARVDGQSFSRDPDFDLAAHAAEGFGSYHEAGEYGEVVWRFRPEAAAIARDFVFHPDQALTEEPDGALTVRFFASGLLEMAWHLYQWGDRVEVLAPPRLAEMVAAHRRSDFPSPP